RTRLLDRHIDGAMRDHLPEVPAAVDHGGRLRLSLHADLRAWDQVSLLDVAYVPLDPDHAVRVVPLQVRLHEVQRDLGRIGRWRSRRLEYLRDISAQRLLVYDRHR